MSKSDEQFEFFYQLLGERESEQFEYKYGDTRDKQERASGNAEKMPQRSQPVAHIEASSTKEIRPDPGREQRKGAPEVIFGETKEVTQIIAMARDLLSGSGRAVISRLKPEAMTAVRETFRDHTMRVREAARAMAIYAPGYVRKTSGGHVGVLSAGTSDIPVAEEAAFIVEEMGCRVSCIYDVGVAGLHRLMRPLQTLLTDEVDAIIVAAGMDGALPSVVAGLVPVPVIGLPTSIGYGFGGNGIAALLSMLQTCAPGLTVVNIDNGVGAGISAALVANRVAQAREHQSQ